MRAAALVLASLLSPAAMPLLPSVGPAAAAELPQQRVLAPGEFRIAGRPFPCPGVETRLFLRLKDIATWSQDYINLDWPRFAAEPPEVQAFIYGHECMHQLRGPDELVADCEGIRMARDLGFVTEASLEPICRRFTWTWGHNNLPGPLRCQRIRACFAD